MNVLTSDSWPAFQVEVKLLHGQHLQIHRVQCVKSDVLEGADSKTLKCFNR